MMDVIEQIHGFFEYGFTESHAASFALLVYASCWLKQHHRAELFAAMLKSSPLGFYSASQRVRGETQHGVVVRPVDVMHSDYDCTLKDPPRAPVIRIGLRQISGFKKTSVERLMAGRRKAPFDGADGLARRAELEPEMRLLAGVEALMSLSGHRRQQVGCTSAQATTGVASERACRRSFPRGKNLAQKQALQTYRSKSKECFLGGKAAAAPPN